ncbi:MAG: hypothetical protein Q9163_003136 [Psora crenata]
MPAPANTLLIEGTFEELADELAGYIDDIQKKHNPDAASIKTDIIPLLEKDQKDDALKKLVTGSSVLNTAPERGFTNGVPIAEFIAAYNLLVHLILQTPQTNIFLPRITHNLCSPIHSSPAHGPGLALSILTTIFNILPQDAETRYHVFVAILRVVRSSGSFETLRPQLKNLDLWIQLWETDEEDQRKLFLQIADVAFESGDEDEAYNYLLRALRTVPPDESASQESHDLAIRALKAALSHPAHFTFQDLTSCDAIQALRKSEPDWYEFLELFNAELLDDYNDFLESHDDFLETSGLSPGLLLRKIRLLTLASLAASTASRSLPYSHIARALQIPAEDVEMWVIDVIRAGLVEGKLSQLNQTFLIHRSTYRVFGEKQWTEVQGRLDTWRASLEGVLNVVRSERLKIVSEREKEAREVESKVNGMLGGGSGLGGGRRMARTEFDD